MIKKYLIGFLLVIFFVIEWLFDVVQKLITVLHESVKELAIYLETTYNEINKKDSEPDSRKDK